jgi:hypothetical protein
LPKRQAKRQRAKAKKQALKMAKLRVLKTAIKQEDVD